MFGSTGGGVVNTGDNSLASDFSREGLGNIDTDEVDPIAEAEVYLAYGRDAQAEEILKDALKKDPQRQEIYLKLLEIHAQHNKPSAFETVAAELYSVSQRPGRGMAKGDGARPAARSDQSDVRAKRVAARHLPRRRRRLRPQRPPAASERRCSRCRREVRPEPRGGTPLDFTLDDDISLSPTLRQAIPRHRVRQTSRQRSSSNGRAVSAGDIGRDCRGRRGGPPRATSGCRQTGEQDLARTVSFGRSRSPSSISNSISTNRPSRRL